MFWNPSSLKRFAAHQDPNQDWNFIKWLETVFLKAYKLNFPKSFRWKKILKMFYLAATISCKSPNKFRVGEEDVWLIWHSNCKHLNQRLLPAITNFLSLSNKTLMIVSIDIPHHTSLPGSRERLTLRLTASPDSPVHWSIN